jgi:hypothetical protein
MPGNRTPWIFNNYRTLALCAPEGSSIELAQLLWTKSAGFADEPYSQDIHMSVRVATDDQYRTRFTDYQQGNFSITLDFLKRNGPLEVMAGKKNQ